MSRLVQDLSVALVTKIAGVSGIADVYDYVPDKPTNGRYPYAAITPLQFDGKFGDTIRNKRTFTFRLGIFQERTASGFGSQKAERLVREICDEIITAFDMDTTLSGMVKWVEPISANLDYDDGETGDRRTAEFIIAATTVVPSFT